MSILFSLIPLIFIIWYFATHSRWKDISWDIRRGFKCPSCKCDIYTKEEEYNIWTSSIVNLNDNKVIFCKSCKRDESIHLVLNKKNKLLLKFRNYLLMVDQKQMLTFFISLVIFATVIDFIISINFGITPFLTNLY